MCYQFYESANKYELKTVDFDHGLRKLSLLILAVPGTLIFMLLPLFLGAVTETFDFSDRQIGFLASADLFGFTLCAGSAVFWIRRVNWRDALLAALLLLFAANLITILLSEFYSLTAIRFFCGFCGGTAYSICIAYYTDTSHPQRLLGMSLATQAVSASGLIYLITAFAGGAGFTGLCYVLAGASLALLPAVIYVPLRGKERPKVSADGALMGKSTILAILGTTIFWTSMFALWAYTERIGMSHGFESGFIGAVLGTSVGLGFIGALVAGYIEDRFGKTLPVLMIVAMHILVVVLLWLGKLPLIFIVAIGLLQFFSYNYSCPVLLGIISTTDTTGRFSVLYNFALGFSAALGPALGGVIVGYDATFRTLYIFCISTVMLTLVLILQVNRMTSEKEIRTLGTI